MKISLNLSVLALTIAMLMSGYGLTANAQRADTTSICAILGDDFVIEGREDLDMTNPANVYWKEIKVVVHVHYSLYDEWANIPQWHVYNAMADLNEQFAEYMFSFETIQIKYHDMIEDGGIDGYNLAIGATCAPYSQTTLVGYIGNKVWDTGEFMNVHLLPDMCSSILGFAFRNPAFYNWMDGVWVQTNVFGMDGDYLLNLRKENKTFVHEVGHYLGLHHPFNGTEICNQNVNGDCSAIQDNICDTPPMGVNWSCEDPTCSDETFWMGKPWEGYVHNNHMDYYIDSCRTAFTNDQFLYMHNHMHHIRTSIIDDNDPTCLGDVNGDYVVGMNDLLSILSCWEEEPVGVCEPCDLNLDGQIGATDILLFNTAYGLECAGPLYDYDMNGERQEAPPIENPNRRVRTDQLWRNFRDDVNGIKSDKYPK